MRDTMHTGRGANNIPTYISKYMIYIYICVENVCKDVKQSTHKHHQPTAGTRAKIGLPICPQRFRIWGWDFGFFAKDPAIVPLK